jgi:hypothetical protein
MTTIIKKVAIPTFPAEIALAIKVMASITSSRRKVHYPPRLAWRRSA